MLFRTRSSVTTTIVPAVKREEIPRFVISCPLTEEGDVNGSPGSGVWKEAAKEHQKGCGGKKKKAIIKNYNN